MIKQFFSRYVRLLAVALMLIAVAAQVIPQDKANALFSPRSLTLVNGATDGGSKPLGDVGHTFDWTLDTTTSTRSIKFQYCTTPIYTQTCTMPTGLDTTGATLASFTPGASGFTIFTPPTNGTIVLTRGAAANITATTQVIAEFEDIINPSAVNQTFFVRISLHTTADGSGAAGDQGSVAASTADPIVLNGIMPESLLFCTGFAVVTNCTSTTSQIANFDDLFSPTVTRWTKAEMAASTNAGEGYAITMWGETMESGSNSIAPMATTAASTPGLAQFGTNLMQNTSAGTFTSGTPLTFSGPGTASNSAAGTAVTGVGTSFLSLVSVGDSLNFTSGGTPESCVVAAVISNTSLTCAAITNAHTTGNYTITQASGTNIGANVNPATNYPTVTPALLRGRPKTGYEVTNMYTFNDGDLVAQSDEDGATGTPSATDGQKFTMTYIVNVPGSQAAGLYSTTLTYICTATF